MNGEPAPELEGAVTEPLGLLHQFLGEVDSRYVWFGYGDTLEAAQENLRLSDEVENFAEAKKALSLAFHNQGVTLASVVSGSGRTDCVKLWNGNNKLDYQFFAAIEPTRETLLSWLVKHALKNGGCEAVTAIVEAWEVSRGNNGSDIASRQAQD